MHRSMPKMLVHRLTLTYSIHFPVHQREAFKAFSLLTSENSFACSKGHGPDKLAYKKTRKFINYVTSPMTRNHFAV